MYKNNYIISLIFALFMISGLRADDDFNDEETEKRSRQSDVQDQMSTFKANVSKNAGDKQIKENESDRRSDFYRNRRSNSYQFNRNNKGKLTNSTAYNNFNNGSNTANINYDTTPYNRNRGYNKPAQPAPIVNDINPNLKDFRTGLSYGTLKILSTLPSCDQQTLLNYRRLLRNPLIRLQFYRDLYQWKQRNYVDGCGEGMVKIGHRERAILLRDPYFREKIELLMARQPIGAALRGPLHYPTDIGATTQPLDPVLILNKSY
jgi:hypothetical protein